MARNHQRHEQSACWKMRQIQET